MSFKARLVIQGFSQRKGIDFSETYAPVVNFDILRLMLVLSLEDLNVITHHVDIRTAFLNAKLKELVFVKKPQGYSSRAPYVQLLRACYGLKQAPREWALVLQDFLIECGYTKVHSTECLYIKRIEKVWCIVCTHVDDLPIVGHPELVTELKNKLASRFKMTDLGELTRCVGIDIKLDRERSTLQMSQQKYALDILKIYKMDECKPLTTPALTDRLTSDSCPKNDEEKQKLQSEFLHLPYRAVVGHLRYLVNTRPDLAHSVGAVSRFIENPDGDHYLAVKRILRYVKRTSHFGLQYRRGSGSNAALLYVYSDADWAGCTDSRRSTSGYIFSIEQGVFACRSRLQRTVSLSSCEAEIIVMSEAGQHAQFLRRVLDEHGFGQQTPTPIYGDNQGSIAYAENSSAQNSRMKHLDVKTYYIRDLVKNEVIRNKFVPTSEMTADILTKPLGRVLFEKFRFKLDVVPL